MAKSSLAGLNSFKNPTVPIFFFCCRITFFLGFGGGSGGFVVAADDVAELVELEIVAVVEVDCCGGTSSSISISLSLLDISTRDIF